MTTALEYETVDVTPRTYIIESIRFQQDFTQAEAISEWIDNSFDAEANQFKFERDKDRITITDDGKGCDDPKVMVTLGDHRAHHSSQPQIGFYGIGAKDAIIWSANTVLITTVCNGKKYRLSCDWKHIQRTNKWSIDAPTVSDTSEKSGTRIILTSLCRPFNNLAETIEELRFRYSPAIENYGKQILFRKKQNGEFVPLTKYEYPALNDYCVKDIVVGGKKARVAMGIVPDGVRIAPRIRGMSISFGYRVIEKNSSLGFCGRPVPGVVATCQLGEGWRLSKNKTELKEGTQQLGEAIYAEFSDFVERASSRSRSIQLDNVAKGLNSILKDMSQAGKTNRKEKREKASSEGSSTKRDSGVKRLRATSTQSGNSITGCSSGVIVEFENMEGDERAWRCDGNVVYLNENIKVIQEAKNDERVLAHHAINALGVYLAFRKDIKLFRHVADDCDRIASFTAYMLSRFGLEEKGS